MNTILNIDCQIYSLYLENIIHSYQSQINLILHKKSGGSKKLLMPYLFYILCYISEYEDKVYNNHREFL
ncbi:hypothetical protein EA208_17450 [Escherichia coli]|nr:hypothetical protein EA208_17450 [Escherichia coli]